VSLFGHRPVATAQALAAGFTRHQLRAALARGLLSSPRHGVVVAATPVASTIKTTQDRDGDLHGSAHTDPSRDTRVIGEADGWSKYGTTDSGVRAHLTAERERQRDLEGAGWQVVRWTSTDYRRTVLRRMQAALPPRDPTSSSP